MRAECLFLSFYIWNRCYNKISSLHKHWITNHSLENEFRCERKKQRETFSRDLSRGVNKNIESRLFFLLFQMLFQNQRKVRYLIFIGLKNTHDNCRHLFQFLFAFHRNSYSYRLFWFYQSWNGRTPLFNRIVVIDFSSSLFFFHHENISWWEICSNSKHIFEIEEFIDLSIWTLCVRNLCYENVCRFRCSHNPFHQSFR